MTGYYAAVQRWILRTLDVVGLRGACSITSRRATTMGLPPRYVALRARWLVPEMISEFTFRFQLA